MSELSKTETIQAAEDQEKAATAQDGPPLNRSSRSDSISTSMTQDTTINRMVDALVGDEEGLDPLQEEDEDLPVTPPATNFDNSAIVRNSSSNAAPLVASDLVDQVQNWHHKSVSGYSGFGARSSTASPFSGGSGRSPKGQLENWHRPPSRSNPSSPHNAAIFAPPGLGAVHSPRSILPQMQSTWHSRDNSVASSASRNVNAFSRPWVGSPFGGMQPMNHPSSSELDRSFGAGGDIWNVTPNVSSTKGAPLQQSQHAQYPRVNSSALFGPDGYPIASDSLAPMEQNGSHAPGIARQKWMTPTSGQGG